MKSIANSTELMKLLEVIASKIDTNNFNCKLEEYLRLISYEEYVVVPYDCDYPTEITKRKVVLTIKVLRRGSLKELLRRLAMYLGKLVSTQFALLNKIKFESLTLFFGLCCSSPGYIFNAIFGTSSHFISSLL